jgi:hypothetical protein
MYPNVFIAEDFFQIFDSSYKALQNKSIYEVDPEFENKRESIYRVKNLLLSSNLTTDVKDQALIKYFSREFGTYNNISDLVLHSLIKENAFANGRKLQTNKQVNECSENNVCYFTDDSLESCDQKSKMLGRIFLGNSFLNNPFYLNHTFATESTDETIPQIEKSKHPCSSLIIIDRYLFEDAGVSKITYLIQLLKNLIPEGLSHPFEVDIITKNFNNDSKIESKYNQLLAAFPGKISLHIYASSSVPEHDRYFITNYAIFSIGIPFTGKSNISCSFYPSHHNREIINKSYNDWLSKVKFSKEIIQATPLKLGLIKTVWQSDQIKHSIFSLAQ